MAISCCQATIVGTRTKLPPVEKRIVNVQCCLVYENGVYKKVDEKIALESKNQERFYFMDSDSWGNMLKVSAERVGRIKEYEQFPCVK